MITREELLNSKEYWLVKLQTALYEQVEDYLNENNMSKTEFANQLGVSKGYVSQILNGDFDHKMSKFIEISLAVKKVPFLKFEDTARCIFLDSIGVEDYIQESKFNIDISFNYTNKFKVQIDGDKKEIGVNESTHSLPLDYILYHSKNKLEHFSKI